MRRDRYTDLMLPMAFLVFAVLIAVLSFKFIASSDEHQAQVKALKAARANQCNAVEYRLAVARSIATSWQQGEPATEPGRQRLRQDLVGIAVQSDGCLATLPPPTVRALQELDANILSDARLAAAVVALDDALLVQAKRGWPLPTP